VKLRKQINNNNSPTTQAIVRQNAAAPLVKVCGKPSILLGFQLSTDCACLHYADVYRTVRCQPNWRI